MSQNHENLVVEKICLYDQNNDNDNICQKILQDIKSCLHLCKNNKKAFDFKNHKEIMYHDPLFYLLECENLQKFKNSLNDINIKMIIKDPVIIIKKGYCVDYNSNNRELIFGSYERCECDDQSKIFYKNLQHQRQGQFWVKTCKD